MAEITAMQENGDGTVTLTVDAVCKMMGSDVVMTHQLMVQFLGDGSVRYLGNQVLEDGLEKIPPYQYRVD